MPDYRAGEDKEIRLRVGQTVTLESLRQAVVPPYVMLMPFLEPPPQVEVIGLKRLPGEGVHGCVFTIRGVHPGTGRGDVGFRDLRTGDMTHQLSLVFVVEPAEI